MRLNSAKDLDVYKNGYALAMRIFELSRHFPTEERFALTSQILAQGLWLHHCGATRSLDRCLSRDRQDARHHDQEPQPVPHHNV
jgi:hypothetical protein